MSDKRVRWIFLIVTLLIASSDAVLVWVNYKASQQALMQSLDNRGQQLRDVYQVTLDQVSAFMRQTATYIANDDRVNRLFWQGRLAVEAEGGGAGGEEAHRIRRELFELVGAGWQEMTKHYKGRQLHFHLPPDVSFLRVHRPEKFGDDLSAIRHSILAANTSQVETMGFESGRVYAGVRGVVPVYYTEPESGQRIHVGALEAGTSFTLMLEQLKNVLDAEFGVLMTMEHARATMWPDFLEEYQRTHPVVDEHLLEASTDKQRLVELIGFDAVHGLIGSEGTVLVKTEEGAYAITAFPLRDYLGTVDPQRPDIGTILVWTPADKELAAFDVSFRNNLMIAIIAFLMIELLLYLALSTEHRLQAHKALALTDGLTHIDNRRSFDLRLAQEMARARRKSGTLSVIICDIDHFKDFNDYYGHLQGDHCLQEVANGLKAELKRSADFVARYGGEEFIAILPNTGSLESQVVAERMRRAVESMAIEHEGLGNDHVVTMSFGVATIQFEKHRALFTSEQVIKFADEALYQAKNNGRNQVMVYADPDVMLTQ